MSRSIYRPHTQPGVLVMRKYEVCKTSQQGIEFYCDNSFFNIDKIIMNDDRGGVCYDGRKLIIVVISSKILGSGSEYFCKVINNINERYRINDTNIIVFCRRRMINVISDTVDNRVLCLPYHSLNSGTDIEVLKHIFIMSFKERNVFLKITPAEKKVIDLYFHNKTYEEISHLLKIKEGTASIYKNKVIKRFGVSNELELFYKVSIINRMNPESCDK